MRGREEIRKGKGEEDRNKTINPALRHGESAGNQGGCNSVIRAEYTRHEKGIQPVILIGVIVLGSIM